jgi:hypothetical protein
VVLASLNRNPILCFLVIAGMTGSLHQSQLFSIEMGSHKLFCLDWT